MLGLMSAEQIKELSLRNQPLENEQADREVFAASYSRAGRVSENVWTMQPSSVKLFADLDGSRAGCSVKSTGVDLKGPRGGPGQQ